MEIAGIEAFVAIAEWESVSEAARRTGNPKSTLSRRLADLERALETRLIDRSRRSVRLTEEGAALLGPARALLAGVSDIEGLMRSRADTKGGLLRVSAPNLLGQTVIAEVAATYGAANPDVSLEVSLSDRYVDLVAEGFDCAVRVGTLRDPDLICRKIFASELILVARSGYERARRIASPADLQSVCCLDFLTNGRARPWTLRCGSERLEVRVDARLRMDSLPALRRALGHIDAVALLPRFLVETELRTGDLIRVCPDWSGETHEIFVVFPSSAFMAPRLRGFIDLLADHLKRLE